jgi:hypothetical protein
MTSARAAGGILAALILIASGCVPPRGGWDVDAVVEAEPSIAKLEGQRLGDMIPFPALDGDRIALVACRFAAHQLVRVRGGGVQWPVGWGQAAVRALDRSVGRVELVLEAEDGSRARARPKIEIVTIEAVGGEGPNGLGDTLSECDVSPIGASAQGANRAYRGLLTGAEIRMRRAQIDMTNQVHDASAEEWVGALMHELAHALGFAGHAAAGDSILVRDETRIRAAGRRALRGEAVPDETLEALYRLRPGQRLGMRRLNAEGMSWLDAIRELDRKRSAAGSPSVGLFSSVGDQEARMVWRYADGNQLGVRFPHWRSELRSGATITLRPDRTTRQWIEVATPSLE